ncbi:LacI family DNA-binding transcriptional regulator [Terriglobus aquaticus]|uniref:LacI family DNA-binding transcriptional regulator n=2 Tax=Terriglobus aquaticus TaxID=940139 RepID=A0ABW9KKU4_9BACT
MLGEYLGLNPGTVSFVLNDTPNRSIPEATRQRVREAAAKFGYEPSHIARSLRSKKTQTLGILLPEMGDGYHSQVLNGMAEVLMRENYFFFTAHHRHRRDLVHTYPKLLHARGAEGLLTIDTRLEETPAVPTVCVANHVALPNVTSVILDEGAAARASLKHLYALGHRRIVFMRGQSFSSDSDTRWEATLRAADELGIPVRKRLTIRLEKDLITPELGYPDMKELLERTRDFTAVLCFNDISAMGVIRSLTDAGLRVPNDCSVVGFDDIPASEYQIPRLTTVRQPLQRLGHEAASALLRKLAGESVPELVCLEPSLIVRESTAVAPSKAKQPNKRLSQLDVG